MAKKLSFEAWTAEVDKLLLKKYGVTSEDGVDWPQWDCWDDGLTPAEAVEVWRSNQD